MGNTATTKPRKDWKFGIDSKGLTLLEVLIALTILAGGIVLVTNSWSGNLMRVRKANLYNNVAFLLEGKMAEVEAKYRGRPLSEIPEEEGDTFEGFPQYRWHMISRDFEMPDMAPILTAGSQDAVPDQLISMIRQTTEFISKSVKEVKVSVFVAAGQGGREVEFSVTTYFVDYNQELPLEAAAGGGP